VRTASDVALFYEMAEPLTEEQFEDVVATCRAEDNYSRANFVAKMRKISDRDPSFKVKQIANLAGRGQTVDQIASFTGVKRGTVRMIARRHNIDLPGDLTTKYTRQIDDDHVALRTVEALEGLAVGLDSFKAEEVENTHEAEEWAESVAKSIKELIKFHKQLKEMAHGYKRG
jgi:hypothetical protein